MNDNMNEIVRGLRKFSSAKGCTAGDLNFPGHTLACQEQTFLTQ